MTSTRICWRGRIPCTGTFNNGIRITIFSVPHYNSKNAGCLQRRSNKVSTLLAYKDVCKCVLFQIIDWHPTNTSPIASGRVVIRPGYFYRLALAVDYYHYWARSSLNDPTTHKNESEYHMRCIVDLLFIELNLGNLIHNMCKKMDAK